MLGQETFELLGTVADMEKTTIGAVVRQAVQEVYGKSDVLLKKRRLDSYRALLAWQKEVGVKKHIDYRKLIEDGRTK